MGYSLPRGFESLLLRFVRVGENLRVSPTVNLGLCRPNTWVGGRRSVLSERPLICSAFGGVAERSNAAVSKTVIRLNGGSRVQIPPPPLLKAVREGGLHRCGAFVGAASSHAETITVRGRAHTHLRFDS